MASQTTWTILVIDDDPGILSGLSRFLRRDGHTVETVDNGYQALERLPEHYYDLILGDLRRPDLDGPVFYSRLRRQYPSVCQQVIVLTGDTLSRASQEFLEQSGRPWVPKPCNAAAVRSVLAQAMRIGSCAARGTCSSSCILIDFAHFIQLCSWLTSA